MVDVRNLVTAYLSVPTQLLLQCLPPLSNFSSVVVSVVLWLVWGWHQEREGGGHFSAQLPVFPGSNPGLGGDGTPDHAGGRGPGGDVLFKPDVIRGVSLFLALRGVSSAPTRGWAARKRDPASVGAHIDIGARHTRYFSTLLTLNVSFDTALIVFTRCHTLYSTIIHIDHLIGLLLSELDRQTDRQTYIGQFCISIHDWCPSYSVCALAFLSP